MAIHQFNDLKAARFEASAAWDFGNLDDPFRTRLTDAIIRNEAISLRWPDFEGAPTLTVLSVEQGTRYRGHSTWAPGTPHEEVADVEAMLYSNELGHVLVGQEHWSSGKSDWFIVRLSNGCSVQSKS